MEISEVERLTPHIFSVPLEVIEKTAIKKITDENRTDHLQEVTQEISEALDFGKISFLESIVIFKSLMLYSISKIIPEGEDPTSYAKQLLSQEVFNPLSGQLNNITGELPVLPPVSTILQNDK